MARVSTYLNFERNTEEVFNFYKSVFGTEFEGGITRMGDMSESELAEEDKNLVMHVMLPILNGHMLMGTDAPEHLTGRKLQPGNNVYITLEPDSRSETDNLFQALSQGGRVEHELQDMPWGSYFGSCTDKYGIQWMFDCENKK